MGNIKRMLIVENSIAIIVASEKGGVRKTSLVAMLIVFLLDLGIRVRVIQVDNQDRLQMLFPDIVETAVLPVADGLRDNDAGDADALDPVMEMMLAPDIAVKIVDVGANFDARLFDCLSAANIPEDCQQAGIPVLCLVPMTSDVDAIKLAGRTAARFAASFPGERMIPVLCETGVDFENLPDPLAKSLFQKTFHQKIAEGDFISHARLMPRSLSMLEGSHLNATTFNAMDPREIGRITAQKLGVAKFARGEVRNYTSAMFSEFEKILPFRPT